jgi:DNA-binding transcriptional MerR regulator
MSYTPQIVSEMLDLPPSTLRRYASDYAPFLSETAQTGGKRRRYTDQDINILRRVRQLVRERKTPEEIRGALGVVDDAPASSALALLPDVLGEFERLRSVIAQMQADYDNTRQELSDTKDRLQQLEDYLHTPWYKRIGKRPT